MSHILKALKGTRQVNHQIFPEEESSGPFTNFHVLQGPGGGGVLPYMGHIGMCGPKVYGFSAVSRS